MSEALAVQGTIWGYRSTRDGAGGVRVTIDLGEIDALHFHRMFPNPHGAFVAIARIKTAQDDDSPLSDKPF